jgi:small subunit ribosomal protein S8e
LDYESLNYFKMGITRDSLHKKKLSGGKKKVWRKKRKHELGRQPSNTKIGNKQISLIRTRGGNYKKRALLLENGNFSMITLGIAKKTKILKVVHNSSNNELVRTNTLVKGSVIAVDSSPFKLEYSKKIEDLDPLGSMLIKKKFENQELNQIKLMKEQFASGKLLARICSRPGQSGRVDGYILEKGELEFYLKKIQKKKSKI